MHDEIGNCVDSEPVSNLKQATDLPERKLGDRRIGRSLFEARAGKGWFSKPGGVVSAGKLVRSLERVGSNGPLLEGVRRLRDSVILSALRDCSKGGVTIAMCGPRGGEGTSLLALLLGLSLGESPQRKVAILDGRFSSQRFNALQDFFGLSIHPARFPKGMSHLSGYSGPAYPNVQLLWSSRALDAVEFFSDKCLIDFLSEVKSRFHITILDLPPLLGEPSCSLVLPFIDRLYLVVEAGKTRRVELPKCARAARAAGGQVNGVILNKQRMPFWARWLFPERFS